MGSFIANRFLPYFAPNPFWHETVEEILKHAIPVLYSATGKVSDQDILDFVENAPAGPEKWKEVAQHIEWNCSARALRKMCADPVYPLPEEDCKRLCDYWMTGEWQTHNDLTRRNLIAAVSYRLYMSRQTPKREGVSL